VRLHRPALAALLLLAAAATPSSARVPRLPELTADTEVTASHSGYLDVVVPEDARLSVAQTRNPDVAVTGAGRFVGLWLQRQQDSGFGDELTVFRLPGFLGGAVRTEGTAYPAQTCTGTPAAFPVTYDCTGGIAPTAIVLHEGRYRITVLTDGSPVAFRLSLHGLDAGSTSLSPSTALASAQRTLPARESLGSSLVTYGATSGLAGNLATFAMATVKRTPGSTVESTGTCFRADQATTPPLGYGPKCPGGAGGSDVQLVHVNGQTYGQVSGFGTAGQADGTPVGIGGSFGGDKGVTVGSTLGAWLQVPAS
jgi:hypothetical protein